MISPSRSKVYTNQDLYRMFGLAGEGNNGRLELSTSVQFTVGIGADKAI